MPQLSKSDWKLNALVSFVGRLWFSYALVVETTNYFYITIYVTRARASLTRGALRVASCTRLGETLDGKMVVNIHSLPTSAMRQRVRITHGFPISHAACLPQDGLVAFLRHVGPVAVSHGDDV